jgi:cytochrome c-type biogenesis protein
MPSVTVPLAFTAGLLSFVSPCVLPLVPVYLGYLSGSSLSSDTAPSRRLVFGHALLFVSGFTFIFILLFGLPTTILGSALRDYSGWIAKIGGAVVILLRSSSSCFSACPQPSWAALCATTAAG